MRWVAGDEIYGEATALRDLVAGSGRWYVLAVLTVTPVWSVRPPVVAPKPARTGATPHESASGGRRSAGDDRETSRHPLA
jgi:hypothetical protein